MNALTKKVTALGVGVVLVNSVSGLTKLGDSIELFVTGTAAIEYQDNLFLDRTGEVDDMVFVASPGVELTMAGRGATQMNLRYKHHLRFYDDNGGLDGDFSDLAFNVAYNSGVVLASFNLSVRELWSNTSDANGNGFLVDRTETRANLNGKYVLTELTAFGLGIEYEKMDYELVQYTGYDSTALPLTVFYKVRPKLDLTAGFRYREVDVDRTNIDFEDVYYFVGAVGELFSPLWTGNVNFGYQERKYDVVDFEESSFFYDMRVTYRPTVKLSFYGGLGRDYRTSASGGASYTFASLLLGGKYAISDSISVDAGAEMGKAEYSNSPREEDMLFWNLGVSYNPNEMFTLRAQYQYQDVDGGNTPFSSDYTNNKFVVSASVRY